GLHPEVVVSGTDSFARLLASPPLVDAADTAADDIGFWLYSSGSTGRPKGTVHTHANLYWTAALFGSAVLGVRESDVLFSAAKLFFAYGLGSTEMLHVFLSNRPGDVRYGTSGRVVPGYRLKLVTESGADAAPGEIGDLYVSGPSSALMYWGNREKSRATFQGEWTHTGD